MFKCKNSGEGRAACAVLGYPAAALGYWMAIGLAGLRSLFADDVLVAGLFGVIPAAVCSWLASGGNKGR